MKLKTPVIVAVVAGVALLGARVVSAQHEHGGGGEHGGGAPHGAEHAPPPRAEAPKFQAHAPGVHPRGATFHSHPMRVLAPKVIVHGHGTYRHWGHPEFARPSYYWDWGSIHSVSCVAEDSYGDQYPVTESTFAGFGLNNMTNVEDDSLDRCYQESGGDNSCYLATCSHY